MSLPVNQVIVGDCAEVMRTWSADSIDLVVTSPPYWGLRNYGLGEDQLGLEPHPQIFIDHLVEICREIRRILKPSGTFWLNLGDTYYASGGKGGQYEKFMPDKGQPDHYRQSSKTRSNWLQPKQLLGMAWRVAIALQHDGWILRNAIIWHKPNHMPGPWKDRLTNAYEHIFLLAKQGQYYFDLDAIRKPHAQTISKEYEEWYFSEREQKDWLRHRSPNDREEMGWHGKRGSGVKNLPHPRGKNPGDIWRIPTAPFPGAHFATFPPKLIEPIIKAGSPKGGVVLDPFGGSGTVGQVARKLGRRFILIEIKPEYADMARQRVRGRYKPTPAGVVQLTQIMEAPVVE